MPSTTIWECVILNIVIKKSGLLWSINTSLHMTHRSPEADLIYLSYHCYQCRKSQWRDETVTRSLYLNVGFPILVAICILNQPPDAPHVWTDKSSVSSIKWLKNRKICSVETLYSTIYYSKYFIELNMISLHNMLPFELTKDTPYLALSGELWSVFYEYFNRNWSCYKGFLLYLDNIWQTHSVASRGDDRVICPFFEWATPRKGVANALWKSEYLYIFVLNWI